MFGLPIEAQVSLEAWWHMISIHIPLQLAHPFGIARAQALCAWSIADGRFWEEPSFGTLVPSGFRLQLVWIAAVANRFNIFSNQKSWFPSPCEEKRRNWWMPRHPNGTKCVFGFLCTTVVYWVSHFRGDTQPVSSQDWTLNSHGEAKCHQTWLTKQCSLIKFCNSPLHTATEPRNRNPATAVQRRCTCNTGSCGMFVFVVSACFSKLHRPFETRTADRAMRQS